MNSAAFDVDATIEACAHLRSCSDELTAAMDARDRHHANTYTVEMRVTKAYRAVCEAQMKLDRELGLGRRQPVAA